MTITGVCTVASRIRLMMRYGTSAVMESHTGMWTNGGDSLRQFSFYPFEY